MDPHATAGRVVHYYSLWEAGRITGPIAAHVNRETTPEGLAQLTVMEASGPRVIQRVMYSESPKPGCWSWMPYQKAKADAADGNQSESAEPRPVVYTPEDFEKLSQHVSEITELVSNLVDAVTPIADDVADLSERVRALEAMVVDDHGEPETEQPPPTLDLKAGIKTPAPLTNQAGEPIHGDEEVPNAAPVDLDSAADNG